MLAADDVDTAVATAQAEVLPADRALADDGTAEAAAPTGQETPQALRPAETAVAAGGAQPAPATGQSDEPAPAEGATPEASDGAVAPPAATAEVGADEATTEAATPAAASPAPTARVAVPSTPEVGTVEAAARGEGDGGGGTATAVQPSEALEDGNADGVLRVIEVALLVAVLGFAALALGPWLARRARRA